jgi:hypothetical protein
MNKFFQFLWRYKAGAIIGALYGAFTIPLFGSCSIFSTVDPAGPLDFGPWYEMILVSICFLQGVPSIALLGPLLELANNHLLWPGHSYLSLVLLHSLLLGLFWGLVGILIQKYLLRLIRFLKKSPESHPGH